MNEIERLLEETPLAQHELYPVIIELNAADHDILINLFDDICNLGFKIRDLGEQKIEISALPDGLKSADVKEWFEAFLVETQEKEDDVRTGTSGRIAASLARSSAVGYGRSLQVEEMRELLDQLFACR